MSRREIILTQSFPEQQTIRSGRRRSTFREAMQHAAPGHGTRRKFARVAYFRPKLRLAEKNAEFYITDYQALRRTAPQKTEQKATPNGHFCPILGYPSTNEASQKFPISGQSENKSIDHSPSYEVCRRAFALRMRSGEGAGCSVMGRLLVMSKTETPVESANMMPLGKVL